jgi:y4mF family transcriptional regulator
MNSDQKGIIGNLAEQVKALREMAGLTQVESARRAGVGLRFVRELEQGKTTVRLDKTNQVLALFGYHVEAVSNRETVSKSNSQI